MEMIRPIFFCIDSVNNFPISDYHVTLNLCLLPRRQSYALGAGREGYQPGIFYRPIGFPGYAPLQEMSLCITEYDLLFTDILLVCLNVHCCISC